jgi:hypothetical protein
MVMCGALMALELPGWAESLVEACRGSGEDVDTALKLAEHYGKLLPQPGRGQTAQRWAVLAAAGEHNLHAGTAAEYPRTGDNVHETLASQPGLNRIAGHTEPDFLAEVYLHGPPVSVAQATGLA